MKYEKLKHVWRGISVYTLNLFGKFLLEATATPVLALPLLAVIMSVSRLSTFSTVRLIRLIFSFKTKIF